MSHANRLIIDCSHAVRRGHRAGVQRVVWNLVEQSTAQPGPTDYQCAIVHQGQFRSYDPQRPPKSSLMREDILAYLPAAYRVMATALCRILPHKKVAKLLLPRAGKLGIFRPWHKVIEHRDRRRLAKESAWQPPGAGDVLLMADGYWCCPKVWPAVEQARQRGALVATLIYDLIPLTHPHFVRPTGIAGFEEYFEQAVHHSDILIAISRTVQEACLSEVRRRWPERLRHLKLSHFALGADLPKQDGQVSAHIEKLFPADGRATPYLMVSTFDPRKNHAFLLQSFEAFWREHPTAQLCLIGSDGWLSRELISTIENHPRFNRQLFKFHSLNDCDLKHCYEHARAVICPSMLEGFGLPVVEAMAHGRKTFVSDIPVHREVGGNECSYFGLGDPSELANLLDLWESEIAGGASLHQPTRAPTTWQASAQELFGQCANLLQRKAA